MKKPDFFLVGAPKCGTTAMYQFLSQHPDIFLPENKEVHFFGTDLYSPHYSRDLEKYLGLFAGATNQKRVGEGSVWYLYSKVASSEIKEFCPGAAILIMLRNPVDMIYSLHGHRLYINSEDIEDFATALEAEEERRRGLRLPANPYPIAGLYYREVGKYAEQVQRYFACFGREQVKVLLYDDFKADPAGVCREVFSFLGVSPAFPLEISVINASKKIRSRALASFLDPPPPLARKVARALTTPEMRHKLFRTVQGMNTEHRPRQPLPPDLKRRLLKGFAPDVQRLSELLGRDLSHWYQPPDEDD
ncbi:MAG: hypothetical protein JWM21_2463 [Acidobacteria bacterium]|nr:hypothetical protein [Acidobacteriota bacterium]